MKAEKDTHNDLVAVNLKILLNLSKAASSLNLRHDQIRSGQSGAYLSKLKGRGMEFDEARLYQPGDDIRTIDWRVTARTGKTHTKVFREERERPVFISVDYRPTMAFATRGVFKSVQAAKLAALLAWAAQQHGDRIGGQIFTDFACQELKPQNGKHAVLRFLNALVSPVFAVSAEMTHCDVVLIQVFDPLESHLPDRGRYRFTDNVRDVVIDTGDTQQILSYQQRFQQQQYYLQQLSKKLRLTLLQCSTVDDPLEVLR
jgi:hypothetical protein